MPIHVVRPSMPPLDEYIEEIRPVFENRILTNMGPVYMKLREQLIRYLGAEELSLFVNGHMALESAILALGLKDEGEKRGGGEIITTPFTFVSTAHAIVRTGLRPVFCDIERSDYCIDPDRIEELITPRTVAVMPVHVYGNICDVSRIESIAEKHGLKVIYDGAHAFGEKYMGRGVGCFGDATVFSFHATKVFNSVEGGAVSFRDKSLYVPLRELKNFGIRYGETVESVGGNAKLDEFRAAMGICNLRHIDSSIAARKAACERYHERLDGVSGIVLTRPRRGVEANYAYFPVYFDRTLFGRTVDDVFAALRENGIGSRRYFHPAVNDLDCYREFAGAETPVARDVSQNILCLPLYEGLEADDVDRICDVILSPGK